ncbi:MAG: hypothetical protein FJ096_17350 [Deltaproteobacteria bacterium]|nr:hypothetical protein [Deltaproteobacteria bacterium]
MRSIIERMRASGLHVEHPSHIELLLAHLPGAPRTPRREAPTPRYFQYTAHAEPWGRPSFDPV